MTPDQFYAALKKCHFRLDQFTSWLGDNPEFSSLINHLRKLAKGEREGLPTSPIQRGFQSLRHRLTSDRLDWPQRFDAALYVIEEDSRADEKTVEFINDIIDEVEWKSCDNEIADSFHAAFAIPILNILLIKDDLLTNIFNIIVSYASGSSIKTEKTLDDELRNAVSVLQNQFSQKREYDAGERAMRREALARVLGLPADALDDPASNARLASFVAEALSPLQDIARNAARPVPGRWTAQSRSDRATGNTDTSTPHTTMPTVAPALWKDRKQERWDVEDPTPVDFIRRHYLKFIGKGGLEHRGQLRILDRGLHVALDRWLMSGHEMPSDIDLPTKTERLDRDLLAAQADPDNKNLSWREAERLRGAARRRAHQSNERGKNT